MFYRSRPAVVFLRKVMDLLQEKHTRLLLWFYLGFPHKARFGGCCMGDDARFVFARWYCTFMLSGFTVLVLTKTVMVPTGLVLKSLSVHSKYSTLTL